MHDSSHPKLSSYFTAGNIKVLLIILIYDPSRSRTGVNSVKGNYLDRLTMGPDAGYIGFELIYPVKKMHNRMTKYTLYHSHGLSDHRR